MRRAQGLASHLVRGSLIPSNQEAISAIAVEHHKLLQCAAYSSRPHSRLPTSISFAEQCTGTISAGVAGAVSFSVAASSIVQEVYAKEPLKSDFLPKDVVLYQYEACPFCNKAKAFLDYYSIPYGIVEVNPISKKEIKWSDYKKVPILYVDGEHMVDSSDIIDKLVHRIDLEKSVGSISDDVNEEKKWRRWVDDHLVHILSPNIYRNPSEALESFDYITNKGNFSFTERIVAKYAGAAAMYFVSKNLKKKYNITAERASLYETAEIWVDALNGREFLGGIKPNRADLAVFGVFRPIRYLRSGRDMVEATLEEAAQLTDVGHPEHNDSYNTTYTTRYEMFCSKSGWKIQ